MSGFPAFIEFQTLSQCNARCQVCPMEWTAAALPQGRMSDDLLQRVLRELEANRETLSSVEPYLNNEPFLDTRFLSVLRDVRRWYGGNVEVSTNASLLTPDMSRAIVQERLVSDFRFSVFGASKETHERIMRRLSWDVVRRNIDNFLDEWQRASRPIRARIVFVENPLLHAPDEAERVRALWAHTGLDITIWRQLDRLGNVSLAINRPIHSGKIVGCKMGYMRDRVAVLYNGDVVLCCQDWSRNHILGNIVDGSIAAVWRSATRENLYRQIYAGESEPGLACFNCELAFVQKEAPAKRRASRAA
jgi:hypothetical protein